MKIQFLRQYRKAATGMLVFVYAIINATAAQIEEYQKSIEDAGRKFIIDETTGQPLYFTTRSVGPKGVLKKTSKGEFVADTSALDQLANLTHQYGIDVAMHVMGGSVPAAAETVVEEHSEPEPAKTAHGKK